LQNTNAVAETVIDGQFCVLGKICVNSSEKQFLTHVNYIELFGRIVKSGEEHYERIVSR